jgi:hypothetical protein
LPTIFEEKMTDFVRLSIAIDSSSAKTVAKSLERLGAAGDIAASKMRRLATAMGSLAGMHDLSSMAMEAAALSVATGGLSMAMNALGQGIGYSSNQLARFEARLMATGIHSAEVCQALTGMVVENLEIGQPDALEAVA